MGPESGQPGSHLMSLSLELELWLVQAAWRQSGGGTQPTHPHAGHCWKDILGIPRVQRVFLRPRLQGLRPCARVAQLEGGHLGLRLAAGLGGGQRGQVSLRDIVRMGSNMWGRGELGVPGKKGLQ